MKAITSWHNFRKYGIAYLTGEADPLGLRVLCDVNQAGHDLICDIMGLPRNTAFNKPTNGCWEHYQCQRAECAYYGLFIPHDMFKTIAVSILMYIEKCDYVFLDKAGVVCGFTEKDAQDWEKTPDQIMALYECVRRFSFYKNQPRSGMANIGAISGQAFGE